MKTFHSIAICILAATLAVGAPEVVRIDRVLVDETPRTLTELGITVSENVVNLSVMNLGSQVIYFAFDSAPNVSNPTVGTVTSPLIPASYGGVNFIITERGAKKLKFRAPAGQTVQMQVQQEGSDE